MKKAFRAASLALAALALGASLGTAGSAAAQDVGYQLDEEWAGLPSPTRVVADPGGDVWVLAGGTARRLGTDGVQKAEVDTSGAREIAVDPEGNVYGIRGGETAYRVGLGPNGWSDRIQGIPHPGLGERPPWLSTLAWDSVSRRLTVFWDVASTAVRRYDSRGTRSNGFAPAFDTDCYWDHEYRAGDAFVLNRTKRTIEQYRDGSRILPDVPLPVAAERMAIGPDGSLFVLARRQFVYRLDRAGGVLDIWDAGSALPGGDPWGVRDLAVGTDGRVYVADAATGSLRIFAPRPRGDVPINPPLPPDAACQIVPNKWASPTRLLLGEQTQVTLSLDGSCPFLSESADIVLVVDRSDSMKGEKLEAAREAVVAFVERARLDRDQIGLVSFHSEARVEVGLTQDEADLVSRARALQHEGGTDIPAAIALGAEVLNASFRRDDPSVKPIMVLMTDGVPFNNSRMRTLAAADEVRYQGIAIYTIGLGEDVDPALLKIVASDPTLYFFAPEPSKLEEVYLQIARRISASLLLEEVTITDVVPDNMEYQLNSAVPPAFWDPATRTLTWELEDVPFAGTEMTYWVEPLEVGEWPTNVRADHQGRDGLDQPQAGPFPVPRVIVEAPTTPTLTPLPPTPTPRATATPPQTPPVPTWTPTHTATATATLQPSATPSAAPSATPTQPGPTRTPTRRPTPTLPPPTPEDTPTYVAPTPTALPSATPEVWQLYVPIVFNDQCVQLYTDVVLVIDASTTMLRNTDAGRLKLQAAKDAARAFLDRLDFEPDFMGRRDQAAIVWYNDRAEVAQELSSDKGALLRAIDGIDPVEGSRIDLGLQYGHRELLPSFSPQRKVANQPALVLLSDGIPNRTSYQQVIQSADAAKLDGIMVYSVGYGRDVKRDTMRRIASQPGLYYEDPTGDELSIIYNHIAGDLVCR